MRELIAYTSIGLGLLLTLWCALGLTARRPGRHSAAYQAPKSMPTLTGPHMSPWPTPTPHHVQARLLPLDGEETKLVRPYAPAEDTLELYAIRERRTAVVLATLGIDYAYTYAGDQFDALMHAASAVTA